MLLAVVAAIAVATLAPLKEIEVVAGLRVNDRIIAQGEIAMSKEEQQAESGVAPASVELVARCKANP